MSKKYIYGSIIGVFAIIIVVAGSTYAWYTWKSNNTNINGNLVCFDIDYDKGQDIGSAGSPYSLNPSCGYKEGAKATVTINTKENCYDSAKATINLVTTAFNFSDGSSAFSVPTQQVLKYQVTTGTGTNETELTGCSGYVESVSTLPICNIDVTPTETTYNVYLYLDCNTVTTEYSGSTYSGYIQTSAYQELE